MKDRLPLGIGVCSWSLLVGSVAELRHALDRLDIDLVQMACGDPHHASWEEGDAMPTAARAAGFAMCGTMLGFPGEDYTTPATIAKTGGFGDPGLRGERLERLRWGLERTKALGLADIMFHAGFVPPADNPDYKPFVDTLGKAAAMAQERGITVAFETGQETAVHLQQFIRDLASPNVRVNFDPANMLLYDMGDPLQAVRLLAPHIRSVHVKDATRPKRPGDWGTEYSLGRGAVDIPRFVQTLWDVGYRGPLLIERTAHSKEDALRDVGDGVRLLRDCVARLS